VNDSRGTLGHLLPWLSAAALVLAPLLAGQYELGQLSLYLCFGALAISLDLAWGQAGILSLGHAAFFGIGAYSMAIVTTRGVLGGSGYAALIVAVVGVGVFAFVLGWFAFGGRVGGPFLAILTMAVSLLLEQVALHWSSLTGGFNGIFGINPLAQDPAAGYYLCAGGLAVVYLTARFVASGPMGLVLTALRDNESRAQFCGYNPVSYRIAVFTISGALASLAGALYAQQSGFVSPTLLGFDLSLQVLFWVVLGGRATLAGAAIGAIAINFVHDSLGSAALNYYELILGAIFIVLVLVLPRGLYGTLLHWASRVRIGRPRRVPPPAAVAAPRADRAVTGPAALATRGLVKSFGPLRVLESVELVVSAGDLRSLIGPNGAGKTTFLNVVTGNLPRDSGDVFIFGERTTGLRPHRLAQRGVGRKFQAPSVFPALTVAENLIVATLGHGNRWPALLLRLVKPRVDADAMELLSDTGLGQRLSVPAATLSHGEQQTLELAMVLAGRPRLLLLDEPTAGLTPRETETAARTLRQLASSRGLTVVAVEHDMGFVRSFSDSVTVLHRGRVIADGTVEAIQADDEVRNAYLGAVT